MDTEESHRVDTLTAVDVRDAASEAIVLGPVYIVLDLEEEEDYGFTGRVDEMLTYDTEYSDSDLEDLKDSDDSDLEEVDAETLNKHMKPLLDAISVPTTTAKKGDDSDMWKSAERGLQGRSKRTRQRHEQQARERQKRRNEAKSSSNPQICFMRSSLQGSWWNGRWFQFRLIIICRS